MLPDFSMMRPNRSRFAALGAGLLCVACCVTGCASEVVVRDPTDEQRGVQLSDGEIARIMLTIHEETVAQARAVTPRLRSAEVQAFADSLRTDHESGWEELTLVLDAASIEPLECDEVIELRQASLDVESLVGDAPRARVDEEFIQAQSALLSYVATVFDARLLSDAQNAALRANLKTWRNRIQRELEEAQRLRELLTERSRSARFTPEDQDPRPAP